MFNPDYLCHVPLWQISLREKFIIKITWNVILTHERNDEGCPHGYGTSCSCTDVVVDHPFYDEDTRRTQRSKSYQYVPEPRSKNEVLPQPRSVGESFPCCLQFLTEVDASLFSRAYRGA